MRRKGEDGSVRTAWAGEGWGLVGMWDFAPGQLSTFLEQRQRGRLKAMRTQRRR